MPKINAATVTEHHALRRGALLAAAADLLLSGGYPALTFGALAERTGLARPTIYSYFRTRDEVAVALCEEALPQVAARVERAVARERTPRGRLVAFVRAQLAAARDTRHRLAHAIAEAPLSAAARQRIGELHQELMPSAVPILTTLGHPQPELAARLLQGVINAAVIALDSGEPVHRTVRVTVAAVLDGFASAPD
ncbi:TetR/AcrR family transcriptional regulator [Micromonospora sp. HM5-17]|uniref:TetR/AcrR family transcriptional regulator n=1 Tax=Micromonospora sp. HM5-17 TaxID=2487710 RepID=UPI000F4A3195|nr:TetR/AcrR family transcriptional regulator [Micromonospora sp. HM5-17]ROT33162.1 TetR/AcrR family transcriptional regulator [Micromonospora sp. HM5-17]